MRKTIIFASILMAAGFGFIVYGVLNAKKPEGNKREIVKQATDQRGLISVVYVEKGDTLALDYLTMDEYKNQFSK